MRNRANRPIDNCFFMRRRLRAAFSLAVGLALAGCSEPPGELSGEEILEAVVQERCLSPNDPWALAHGILVYGKELRLESGEFAYQRLVEDNLYYNTSGEPAFKLRTKDNFPIESHPGLFFKTLLEVGVAPSSRFALENREVSFAELVRGFARRYRPGMVLASSGPPFRNHAWLLEVVSGAAEQGDPELAQLLVEVRTEALEVLAQNQAYFKPFMNGERDGEVYEKPSTPSDGRPQPAEIHRFYCEGFHLFQSVQRMHGKTLPALLKEQYEIALYRLNVESAYWARTLAQVRQKYNSNQSKLQVFEDELLAQRLKLLGHGLETYLRAIHLGVLDRAPVEGALDRAFEELDDTVVQLHELQTFDRLESIQRRNRVLYHELVGDAAHALHAYKMRQRLPGTGLPAPAGDQADALHDAARAGELEKVRQLLDSGVPVDAVNEYDVTALMYAAGWDHPDVVRLLIERGADLDHRDNLYRANAMTWASQRGHSDVIVLLVEHGESAKEAILTAVANGDVETVKALIGAVELSAETLIAVLSRANLDGAEEVAAVLQVAGVELPPASTYKISPHLLTRYAGVYGFERQRTIKLELTYVAGQFSGTIQGKTFPLEALDDLHFRQRRGTFVEIEFEVEGETVKAVELMQTNFDAPRRFIREQVEAALQVDRTKAIPETATDKTGATEPAVPAGVAEQNWTGFRGIATAGTARGTPPLTWDIDDGTSILWKTPVAGRGHASPIVWGDRIYVATAVYGAEEKPLRTGVYGDPDLAEIEADYSWRLFALDRSSGKVVWERAAHEGAPRAKHHMKASQANATPVTDGHRVVALLGSEGLFCYDVDGNLLWRRDLGTLSVGWFYDSGYEWGHASSPILHGDRVIIQVDRGEDPFIAAYSLEDGSEIWRTSRDNLPSWGTPALIDGPAGTEIVTNGSRLIRGYDADSGRELWSMGPHSEITVGSVVTGHGLAFVTGGWPPVKGTYAIRPGGRGDISLAKSEMSSDHIAWRKTRGGTYVPTPLVYGDHLYTLANNGILTAFDARTGERILRERVAGRGGAAFSASPVAAAGRLYIASEEGDVYVVRHGREFELLAVNPMGEIVIATPAISGNMLIIRTLEHVWAIADR